MATAAPRGSARRAAAPPHTFRRERCSVAARRNQEAGPGWVLTRRDGQLSDKMTRHDGHATDAIRKWARGFL